jgi:hypothetical protein
VARLARWTRLARPTRVARLTDQVYLVRMEFGDQRQGGLVACPDRALQLAGLLA